MRRKEECFCCENSNQNRLRLTCYSQLVLLQPLISASLEYFEEMMTYGICHKAPTYCNCFLYHSRVFLSRLQRDISALTLLTST